MTYLALALLLMFSGFSVNGNVEQANSSPMPAQQHIVEQAETAQQSNVISKKERIKKLLRKVQPYGVGILFCTTLYGTCVRWNQTSHDNKITNITSMCMRVAWFTRKYIL